MPIPCQTLLKESTQQRERKRNKGQGPKSRQANSPEEAGHNEEMEPVHIKSQKLDMSTKERGGKPNKTWSLGRTLMVTQD